MRQADPYTQFFYQCDDIHAYVDGGSIVLESTNARVGLVFDHVSIEALREIARAINSRIPGPALPDGVGAALSDALHKAMSAP